MGELYDPERHCRLFHSPGIFLSASVPYKRDSAEVGSDAAKKSERYVKGARPDRIRAAVVELCRLAFRNNIQIVFGGHPAISPLVLAAARQFGDASDMATRVVVFQSLRFENSIPQETLALADWTFGKMLWTEASESRADSLTSMRQCMVRLPTLVGGVAIGGMDGVVEEAQLFRSHDRRRLFLAVGSTQSAARELLEDAEADYAGRKASREVLSDDLCYPRVMRAVCEDFGILVR